MTTRFSLKSFLASNTNVDLDDSLNAKRALKSLGLYKLPKYGLTPYPDQELFDGIKRVQRSHGLPDTGEMRPGDAT